MRVTILLLVVVLLVISCSGPNQADRQFENLANNYIERLLFYNPEYATALGEHRYDNRMNDYSLEDVSRSLKMHRLYLDSLREINFAQLNQTNRIDARILENNLAFNIFYLDTLREYEWNPLNYNIGNGIYSLLARDFAPLPERLINVKSRLEEIPSVLDNAKINLKNPPKVHTETAILQNKGNISLIETDLTHFLKEAPELQEEFKPAQDAAVKALKDYGEWLEDDLLPGSDGEFRLGEEKYRRKLYYSLESDYTKETILAMAEKDLKETQEAMHETAKQLFVELFPQKTLKNKTVDRKKLIKTVLDKLAEEHPTNENIVELAEASLASCTDFVRSHNIVTVPDKPVRIIVMPEFQRGVAVAYCDSPGPLEEGGETFYAISPTPEDWSKNRVKSFFREYNNYMLENLTVHEAMPGHFLQLAHGNQFNAPTKIRSIFYSGTFVEGWATYSEQLMVEAGYLGPELKMQQLKMRLRLLINAIIDQKIHTAGMTEQQAMDLMMNEGFQEEGEAAGKWRRACLTSAQLSTYFVGNMEVNDIRNSYEAKMGDTTDLKTMHDLMLSFGSPAPKYVKQMMGI